MMCRKRSTRLPAARPEHLRDVIGTVVVEQRRSTTPAPLRRRLPHRGGRSHRPPLARCNSVCCLATAAPAPPSRGARRWMTSLTSAAMCAARSSAVCVGTCPLILSAAELWTLHSPWGLCVTTARAAARTPARTPADGTRRHAETAHQLVYDRCLPCRQTKASLESMPGGGLCCVADARLQRRSRATAATSSHLRVAVATATGRPPPNRRMCTYRPRMASSRWRRRHQAVARCRRRMSATRLTQLSRWRWDTRPGLTMFLAMLPRTSSSGAMPA